MSESAIADPAVRCWQAIEAAIKTYSGWPDDLDDDRKSLAGQTARLPTQPLEIDPLILISDDSTEGSREGS